MALTQRAQDWLARLPRFTPVPTVAQVEKQLLDGGYTPHPAWLAFHDRYAGYIEAVARNEPAFWGLMHPANRDPPLSWVEADRVYVIPADPPRLERIGCADAHPVHDYLLTSAGRFLGPGGPVASFDVKVERAALMGEFHARGKAVVTHNLKDLNSPACQALMAALKADFEPEPSDDRVEYYMQPTRLLVVAPKRNALWMYEIQSPTTP